MEATTTSPKQARSLVPMIQYVERFWNQQEADCCLASLKSLDGYVAGRSELSDSFGEAPFVAQAFFEYVDGVNPEAISSCCGLRSVLVPLAMLTRFSS